MHPKIRCVNDSTTACEGAHGGKPGLHLIAGTGSVCVGKAPSGTFARVGGLGPLFDDRGSGHDIGRMALEQVVQAGDGRRGPVSYAPRLFDFLDVRSVPELYQRIHGDANARALVASLVPLVFRIASEGDPDAVVILEQAAQELAALVTACAGKLDWPAPAITMSGSPLEKQPAFRRLVRRHIRKSLPLCFFAPSLSSPLQGAVRLARSLSHPIPSKTTIPQA